MIRKSHCHEMGIAAGWSTESEGYILKCLLGVPVADKEEKYKIVDDINLCSMEIFCFEISINLPLWTLQVNMAMIKQTICMNSKPYNSETIVKSTQRKCICSVELYCRCYHSGIYMLIWMCFALTSSWNRTLSMMLLRSVPEVNVISHNRFEVCL